MIGSFALLLTGGGGASRLLPTTCITAAGFWCTNLTYSAHTGNAMALVGQFSLSTYYNTAFAFVPNNSSLSTNYYAPKLIFTPLDILNTSYTNNLLPSGEEVFMQTFQCLYQESQWGLMYLVAYGSHIQQTIKRQTLHRAA